MKLKHYLISNLIVTIIAWLLWLFILFRVDPFATNWLGRCLFYLALFSAIFGTMSLVGFVCRFSLIHQRLAHQAVIAAFRQAGLLAFGVVVTLWLLSQQLFNWFNLLILAGGLAMLEFFMLSCQSNDSYCQTKQRRTVKSDPEIISSSFDDESAPDGR
ncbi:hypothetical protein EOM71_00870 [Candidatus Falkowbacteria bacterium]|jgi:hypothetical protein|nr:hypothetical protein [Candidatus Falkowbacteria bacterium]